MVSKDKIIRNGNDLFTATDDWFENGSRTQHLNNGIIGSIEIAPNGKTFIELDKRIEGDTNLHGQILRQLQDAGSGWYALDYFLGGARITVDAKPNEVLGDLLVTGLITQEEMLSAYKGMNLSPDSPKSHGLGNKGKPLNQPSFSLF
jgi:hypothetical protein